MRAEMTNRDAELEYEKQRSRSIQTSEDETENLWKPAYVQLVRGGRWVGEEGRGG